MRFCRHTNNASVVGLLEYCSRGPIPEYDALVGEPLGKQICRYLMLGELSPTD